VALVLRRVRCALCCCCSLVARLQRNADELEPSALSRAIEAFREALEVASRCSQEAAGELELEAELDAMVSERAAVPLDAAPHSLLQELQHVHDSSTLEQLRTWPAQELADSGCVHLLFDAMLSLEAHVLSERSQQAQALFMVAFEALVLLPHREQICIMRRVLERAPRRDDALFGRMPWLQRLLNSLFNRLVVGEPRPSQPLLDCAMQCALASPAAFVQRVLDEALADRGSEHHSAVLIELLSYCNPAVVVRTAAGSDTLLVRSLAHLLVHRSASLASHKAKQQLALMVRLLLSHGRRSQLDRGMPPLLEHYELVQYVLLPSIAAPSSLDALRMALLLLEQLFPIDIDATTASDDNQPWPLRCSFWALLEALLLQFASPLRDASLERSMSMQLPIPELRATRLMIEQLLAFGVSYCEQLAASHSSPRALEIELCMNANSFSVFQRRVRRLGTRDGDSRARLLVLVSHQRARDIVQAMECS